jgi:hypothetical protein
MAQLIGKSSRVAEGTQEPAQEPASQAMSEAEMNAELDRAEAESAANREQK